MLANGQGAETTGARAVLEGLSGLQDQELAKRFNIEPAPRAVAQEYLSLYPNRVQGILRPPGCKTWVTVSKHFPITDETILSAVAGEETNFWGLRWGDQTRFAVLDIDKGSKYHQAAELQNLQEKLSAVGLRATSYRSSDSGGWHIYLFFEDWAECNDLKETLKTWLYGHDYEVRNGTLEVFPSGMGLRLPLQAGFGWLDDNAELIAERKELTRDAAISRFISDLKNNCSNWENSKRLIKTQLAQSMSCQGVSAQAHQEAIEIEGFEELFNYRLIEERYRDGRRYWQEGLRKSGERHDAILAVEHYLWHGDQSAGLPALPGNWNNNNRYRLIRAWIEAKHNGFCNHINRGNWRKVEAQIRRAVVWRRPSGAVRVRTPYELTERSIERLIALSKSTGRTWTPEDLEKGNNGREEGARKKIGEALQLLIAQGRKVTGRQLMRLTGCSYHTVRRHSDMWKISPVVALPRAAGDQNPFVVLDYGLDLKGRGGTVPGGTNGSEKENLLPSVLPSDSGDLDGSDSQDIGELAPIVITPPLSFCLAESLPANTPHQAQALRVASQALTPGPVFAGIQAEGQTMRGGSEPEPSTDSREVSAALVSASSGLFAIAQTYKVTEKQTTADVSRRCSLIRPFEISLHQPTVRLTVLTSSCRQCCVSVCRFSVILQVPKVGAWITCRQLIGRSLGILVYAHVRGPPSCRQRIVSQSM